MNILNMFGMELKTRKTSTNQDQDQRSDDMTLKVCMIRTMSMQTNKDTSIPILTLTQINNQAQFTICLRNL